MPKTRFVAEGFEVAIGQALKQQEGILLQ